MYVLVGQLCPTLLTPQTAAFQAPLSIHGILQTRILEWAAMIPPLWQKMKRNWGASWWKWKRSEKAGLKLNIQKTKIMASGPIISWQIDGETMETVADFISLGSKITLDTDYSHEIKRHLLLGRKAMTNLDSILKSRDITLPTKICLVKAMVFPVVMYGCESLTIKKAAAAATAKLLQSCPTLCDPIDGSPPGSSSQGKLSTD